MMCPCHSKKPYAACCEPYHKGALPKTAEQLMRSRFSAYALGLTRYIIATESCPSQATEIEAFSSQTSFDNLEILNFQEKGDIATVTFRATLKQNGRDASFTEKSLFEKAQGKWLYKNCISFTQN